MLLLKNVCKCVTRWNETLESSRCWRVVERERVIRFGGWCAQKWYEKTRKKRERFSKRYFARRERERHKRTGEEDLFVWERKESFGAKKWFHMKKFFSIDRFLWIFDKFFGFRFGFELFSTLLLSKTASLKERQLHSNISNYGQKNEIGEKSREIGTTKRRASRAWRWDALSPFAALLFCALLSVFIYIYIWYINLDSPNSKGFPSPNSLVPEGINL